MKISKTMEAMYKTILSWVLTMVGKWLSLKRDGDGDERRLVTTAQRKQIARGVKKFFRENYELRYNILKQTEEFRPRHPQQPTDGKNTAGYEKNAASYEKNTASYEKNTAGYEKNTAGYEKNAAGYDGNALENCGGWRQLTDRELRRIAIEQMEQVGVAWSIDVELYVRSTLVPDFNPVADYLARLPQWDGTDRIRPLARRVPTAWNRWPDFFHRWMLAVVAQWQQRSLRFGNAVVPMLIGQQGTHKSTFCRMLLPPTLRDYYIDDIKLDSAEQVERMLARMLLVNIDEYNAKTDREQAKIKRVLTERDVQTRRMRSDQYLLLPRMASFIATTNNPQPLTDPTGSRRYLCCDVAGTIDTDTAIDYQQVYAQAVSELDAGAAWHFTPDEEAAIEEHNAAYRQECSAEALLLAYYRPAPRKKANFLRAVDIQEQLRRHVTAKDVPNMKTLTTALRNCRFPYGSYKNYRGWYAAPAS